MREVDRIAIEELGPNLFQMMENAGRTLALEALDQLSAGEPVVVCAGSGGNGGGVICAARHLANHGVDVAVYLGVPEERLGPVPRAQLEVFRATPGHELRLNEIRGQQPGLWLDGLIGYSLRGPPRDPLPDLIATINASAATKISLDVPSGIDATTGAAPGAHVRPDITLTLALPKVGLAHADSGAIVLADIGIPNAVYRRAGIAMPQIFSGQYRVPIRVSEQAA